MDGPYGVLLLVFGGVLGVVLLVAFALAGAFSVLTFAQWIVDRRIRGLEPNDPTKSHVDAIGSTFVNEIMSAGTLFALHPVGMIDPPQPSERILQSGRPILLVPGFTQCRTNFVLLGPRLSGFGLGPLYTINLPGLEGGLEHTATLLSERIDQIRRATGARQIDVVAHSTGGLVARLVDLNRKEPRIRRLVTLGTPHLGTNIAHVVFGKSALELRPGSSVIRHLPDPPPGQLVSISSTHDFMVSPPENARVEPVGRDVVVRHVGHFSLLTNPEVGLEVVKALGEDILIRRSQDIFEAVEAPEPELAAQL